MLLMTFKTNLVFITFLVVLCGFMYSRKDMNVNKFRIPTTKHFFKGESVTLSKGLLMVNTEKWGVKMKSGGDANLLLLNFYVLLTLSSHLSVFSKLCIMNTLLHFLLLWCQSCCSPRNNSFGGRILGLIKCTYHGWLSVNDVIIGVTLFTSCLGPPNLKPTTAVRINWLHWHLFVHRYLASWWNADQDLTLYSSVTPHSNDKIITPKRLGRKLFSNYKKSQTHFVVW